MTATIGRLLLVVCLLGWSALAPAQQRSRPQLATGAAFAPDGRLWIVGLDENRRLFVQHSPADAPGRWSERRLVDTGADEISADGENRPKLAFGPNGWAVISYTQPLAKPYTGFIRMLRSTDGGERFGEPFTVHQDRQLITHRFESIAFDSAGRLHTLWIDKRDVPARPAGRTRRNAHAEGAHSDGAHATAAPAAADYAGAAVYGNVSTDGGETFGPDTKLADHSCECCRIALAPAPDGSLRAMWRHVFGTSTRDHAFAVVASPQPNRITRASFDDWQIDACPHHGPGLAPAARGQFHALWFGIRKVGERDEAAVRYARLQPDGAPVPGTERVLPDDAAEHADVAAHGDRVVIVWRSSQGQTTTLQAWLSDDGGRTFVRKTLATADGHNDHPRLAQQGRRIVVVWRLMQETQVHDLSS